MRGKEDRRQSYVCAVADDLARADAELVLLLAELDQVQKMPDLTKGMRRKLAVEIRQSIKVQSIHIDWLVQEMDRIKPNWRTWLKPTDPRYDPTERPHHHIGAD